MRAGRTCLHEPKHGRTASNREAEVSGGVRHGHHGVGPVILGGVPIHVVVDASPYRQGTSSVRLGPLEASQDFSYCPSSALESMVLLQSRTIGVGGALDIKGGHLAGTAVIVPADQAVAALAEHGRASVRTELKDRRLGTQRRGRGEQRPLDICVSRTGPTGRTAEELR